MGKDLRGKELGVGISQRKDGFYTARFTGRNGKRKQQYFKKLQECRNWLADAQFADEHGGINASSDMSVNAWFDYWIAEIKGKTVRWNTLKNYKNQYNNNIKEFIGNMPIKDVRPMHCQNVLNIMDKNGYANGSMEIVRTTMSAMFSDAYENSIIPANPVTKSVKYRKQKKDDARVLTLEEQEKLLSVAKGNVHYNHFLFVLHTGVRLSELRGLKWCDIDFQNRIIRIRQTLTYNSSSNKFILGGLKTNSGQRDIPMTETAYRILVDIKKKNAKNEINVFPLEFADQVFLNRHNRPIADSGYDDVIKRLCKKAGISRISMHTLRHTFATRCIEAGMKPKTLQKILGHSNISMTMDLYVHVTEDEKEKEMKKFEQMCKTV